MRAPSIISNWIRGAGPNNYRYQYFSVPSVAVDANGHPTGALTPLAAAGGGTVPDTIFNSGALPDPNSIATEFVAKLTDVMDFLLPRYIAEGKAQLTVGIGCTGGRHRSVYIARRLYDHLAANDRLAVAVPLRGALAQVGSEADHA